MDRKRIQQLVVTLLVVAIVMAVLFSRHQPIVEANDADYYTGPRRSKSDPNVWVTADGKIVPPPADAAPAPSGGGSSSVKSKGE